MYFYINLYLFTKYYYLFIFVAKRIVEFQRNTLQTNYNIKNTCWYYKVKYFPALKKCFTPKRKYMSTKMTTTIAQQRSFQNKSNSNNHYNKARKPPSARDIKENPICQPHPPSAIFTFTPPQHKQGTEKRSNTHHMIYILQIIHRWNKIAQQNTLLSRSYFIPTRGHSPILPPKKFHLVCPDVCFRNRLNCLHGGNSRKAKSSQSRLLLASGGGWLCEIPESEVDQ